MNSRYLLTMLPKSAWEQFNNLYTDFSSKNKSYNEDLYQIIRNSQRFFAIISDGMQRNDVFNFIKLGRFIERADMLSRIIEDQILRKENFVNKYYQNLQWSSVLKSINGFESFKTENKENLNQEIVLKFIVMEKLFPRSLKYCENKLLEVLKYLCVDILAVLNVRSIGQTEHSKNQVWFLHHRLDSLNYLHFF